MKKEVKIKVIEGLNMNAYIVGRGISDDLSPKDIIEMYEDKIRIPKNKETIIPFSKQQAVIIKFENFDDDKTIIEFSDNGVVGTFNYRVYKRNSLEEYSGSDEFIEDGTLEFGDKTKKIFTGENYYLVKIFYY